MADDSYHWTFETPDLGECEELKTINNENLFSCFNCDIDILSLECMDNHCGNTDEEIDEYYFSIRSVVADTMQSQENDVNEPKLRKETAVSIAIEAMGSRGTNRAGRREGCHG